MSHSPLSRIVELDGLITGVNGKLALWRALRDVADRDRRLDRAELERLMARAESQIARLHEHHRVAVRLAFSR